MCLLHLLGGSPMKGQIANIYVQQIIQGLWYNFFSFLFSKSPFKDVKKKNSQLTAHTKNNLYWIWPMAVVYRSSGLFQNNLCDSFLKARLIQAKNKDLDTLTQLLAHTHPYTSTHSHTCQRRIPFEETDGAVVLIPGYTFDSSEKLFKKHRLKPHYK